MNPFDGQGQYLENVTKFRHTLIECDKDEKGNLIPFKKQLRMLLDSMLPISAVVCSGGKSLHAVVRVDARHVEQYRKRVRFIHDYLAKVLEIPIDPQTTNANRTPRMPGVARNGNVQYLIGTGFGCADYAEWIQWISDTPC